MTQPPVNLWSCNHPRLFWRCQPDPDGSDWDEAVRLALPVLDLASSPQSLAEALELALGEGQFGPYHWQLKPARRLYYILKPWIPRAIVYELRRRQRRRARAHSCLNWPVEERYAYFQWEVMRQLLTLTHQHSMNFIHFWPQGRRFALVLTHDVETGGGQKRAGEIADLEEQLGFRSSFNFVPERYPLDNRLIQDLTHRGFEIGIHGLKHDGKLYFSERRFNQRARKINHYLQQFGAVGFRSPLMHRHPGWMQALKIEYDLSFFDTDPYEPLPGGCMSIWPFTIGHFIELPCTLVQDCTLANVLGETTPQLWLSKVDFLVRYCSMALLSTHPDYIDCGALGEIYPQFLREIKARGDYWHALPRDVARWWRKRSEINVETHDPQVALGSVFLDEDTIRVNGTGVEKVDRLVELQVNA